MLYAWQGTLLSLYIGDPYSATALHAVKQSVQGCQSVGILYDRMELSNLGLPLISRIGINKLPGALQ